MALHRQNYFTNKQAGRPPTYGSLTDPRLGRASMASRLGRR